MGDLELEELRYPWDNVMEFVQGGYAFEAGSLHLVMGWVFVLGLTFYILTRRRFPLVFRLSAMYFVFTVFTNPAYEISGLKVNEIWGMAAVFWLAVTYRPSKKERPSVLVIGLLMVFVISLVHSLTSFLVYPELISEPGAMFTKFALTAKIVVLAANLFIVGRYLEKDGESVFFLAKTAVVAGTAGLVLYLVQGGLLAAGTVPYGTYLDAGFVGLPSFGSVSVERGHFGKFMASYYPFFLAALLLWKWRVAFGLLCVVTLINFSASSQAFFVVFMLMCAWKFRDRLFRHAPWLLVAGVGIAVLGVSYADAFAAIFDKIYELGIRGDEDGGRGWMTFVQYIGAYPWGMGYSGSTLRIAPNLPEINSAYYAFFTQYSLLGFPILVAYLALFVRLVSKRSVTPFAIAMAIGVQMSLVIFITDILWFVPMIWLPFEILLQAERRARRLRTASPKVASPTVGEVPPHAITT
jgi:hypothetical protein